MVHTTKGRMIIHKNLTVTLLLMTACEKRDGSSLMILPPRSSPLVMSKVYPDGLSTEVALNCIKADFSIMSAASLLITSWMGPVWSALIWNLNSIMLSWLRRREVGGGSAGLRGERERSLAAMICKSLHKGVESVSEEKQWENKARACYWILQRKTTHIQHRVLPNWKRRETQKKKKKRNVWKINKAKENEIVANVDMTQKNSDRKNNGSYRLVLCRRTTLHPLIKWPQGPPV